MEKLTKEEIVGELLINGEITGEEAITLLSESTTREELEIINPYNYTTTRT
tara:strand:- start:268 stop:420 length:153 start_codon:yes stop_codon:yes gene_type:complete